jgi:hypothetical protein
MFTFTLKKMMLIFFSLFRKMVEKKSVGHINFKMFSKKWKVNTIYVRFYVEENRVKMKFFSQFRKSVKKQFK